MKSLRSMLATILVVLCLVGQDSYSQSLSESDILSVQKQLKSLGYDPGPLDGILGQKTRQAVIKFQTDHGLNPSGRIDEDTQRALNRTWTMLPKFRTVWSEMPDWFAISLLAALLYLALVIFRALAIAIQPLGLSEDQERMLYLGAGAMLVGVVLTGGVWFIEMIILSLILMALVIGLSAALVGGFAAGSLLHEGGAHAILPVLFLLASIAQNFLPAPQNSLVYVGGLMVMGIQGYNERGEFLSDVFGNESPIGKILVWPPLILLFTFADLVMLQQWIAGPLVGIGISVFTAICMWAGYND